MSHICPTGTDAVVPRQSHGCPAIVPSTRPDPTRPVLKDLLAEYLHGMPLAESGPKRAIDDARDSRDAMRVSRSLTVVCVFVLAALLVVAAFGIISVWRMR